MRYYLVEAIEPCSSAQNVNLFAIRQKRFVFGTHCTNHVRDEGHSMTHDGPSSFRLTSWISTVIRSSFGRSRFQLSRLLFTATPNSELRVTSSGWRDTIQDQQRSRIKKQDLGMLSDWSCDTNTSAVCLRPPPTAITMTLNGESSGRRSVSLERSHHILDTKRMKTFVAVLCACSVVLSLGVVGSYGS